MTVPMNPSPTPVAILAVTPASAITTWDAAAWIIHNNPEAAAVLDVSQPGAPVVQINAAFAAMTLHSAAMATKVAGATSRLPDLLGLDTTNSDWLTLSKHVTSGTAAHLQCRAYRQQREAFWANISVRPLAAPPTLEALTASKTLSTASMLAIVVVRDDSAAWLSAQTTRQQVRRIDALLAEIDEAVLQANGALVLSAINPAAEVLTGWSAVSAAGRPLADVIQLMHTETGAALGNPLLSALLTGEEAHGMTSAVLQREDGSCVPVTYRTAVVRDDEGNAIEGLLLLRNVSTTSVLVDTVVHSAGHDALTDLPNRSTFEDRLKQALALAFRYERLCAILLIEVSNFGQMTSSFGQNAGDEVLKVLAVRLRAVFRRSDTVCRLSAARFAVMLPVVDNQATPDALAAKACSGASQPVLFNAHEHSVNLRVGVAIYPMDGDTLDTLMACAATQL